MNFDVISIPAFDRKARQLIKKFPSLKEELSNLAVLLASNPTTGAPLGHHCYKIRIAISSKKSGKSGGARVITNIHVAGNKVYLLSIYDKSEQDTISEKDLLDLLKSIR